MIRAWGVILLWTLLIVGANAAVREVLEYGQPIRHATRVLIWSLPAASDARGRLISEDAARAVQLPRTARRQLLPPDPKLAADVWALVMTDTDREGLIAHANQLAEYVIGQEVARVTKYRSEYTDWRKSESPLSTQRLEIVQRAYDVERAERVTAFSMLAAGIIGLVSGVAGWCLWRWVQASIREVESQSLASLHS